MANKVENTEHHEEGLAKGFDYSDKNQDDASRFIGQLGGITAYSAQEANRVRWKLDLILLPMMTMTYLLSFMDKVALSQASIFGILEDDVSYPPPPPPRPPNSQTQHLRGTDYSWASAVFYFGYLAAQYPCAVLMQKLPIGRYFGVMIVGWGVATTAQAGARSFAALAGCRFLLGACETCISPVLTILVGQYWTRREHPMRATAWWAGAGVGGLVADAVTYAVSGGGFAGGRYATWQLIFLIFGPISIAWGVFLFFALPTSPMTAWFLTEREREVAVLRKNQVIENHTGIENRTYKVHQAKEALLDPQVWMLCANSFLQCIPGGGLTAASPIPGGAIAQAIPNVRIATMIVTNIIVLIGSVLVEKLPANQSLGPMFILYVNTVPYIMCMSLVASNIGGFTKKATAAVMMFMSYSVGQIAAPHFFLAKEKPRYPTGFRAFYVSLALMIAVELLLLVHLWRANSKKEKTRLDGGSSVVGGLSADFGDLTDKEHPEFRYVY
ncbi:Major facilitator superfamily general substrate transporter [Cordyceps militaris]|uniref:Major facilitator superfamily general substrate transporter n=1 Tax=Cordyceps militaris TaxID=73501 RepID=A0A2H4SLH1_CORMI|nr:Major facilitator superfamily general substrate transporter [Cordyceps militaris]